MAKPARPSDPLNSTGTPRTFFVTTRTAEGKPLLQTDRMAGLLVEVLRRQVRLSRFKIHDFVVMADHVHILLTVPGNMSVEHAMQLVKGGFSFRAAKELGFRGEIWQRGFSDVRVTSNESFNRHRAYIENNPVKAGLADKPEEFVHGSAFLKSQRRASRA